MNEQHTWDEFEATMDAVDRGGGGQQSEAKQKPDAFCTAENFAKSPSVVLPHKSVCTLSVLLLDSACLLNHLRDLIDPDDQVGLGEVEEMIDDLMSLHECLEDAIFDTENDK